jgi:hypothetical protein
MQKQPRQEGRECTVGSLLVPLVPTRNLRDAQHLVAVAK